MNQLFTDAELRTAKENIRTDESPERQILAQVANVQEIAQKWSRAVNALQQKNVKSEGVRMSKPNEVLALEGVDWVGDKVSILNQLKEHKNEINKQPRVYSVEYVGETTNALINAVMEQVKQSGGESMKNGKVTFTFDHRGAEKIVEHADNEGLRAAAIIAPYVAKHGVLISGQKNHDNRGYPTLTFASPVYINGTEANVGVVIQFSRDGRPHAVGVEVDFENGSKKIKAEKGLGERSSVTKRPDSPTNSASKNSISSKTDSVKRSDAEKSSIMDKQFRMTKQGAVRTFEQGDTTATVIGSPFLTKAPFCRDRKYFTTPLHLSYMNVTIMLHSGGMLRLKDGNGKQTVRKRK